MAVIIDNKKEEDSDLYPTLFGFPTKNGFASKCLNFIYVVVMIVATAFAFHALNLILPDWNSGIIFLAALSVVGLPYCIKIIMYGREVFEYKHAVLCILISILPTIFDFIGFYSETSIRQALMGKKFEVLETVNYFDKEARKSLNKEIINLENETNKRISEKEQFLNIELKKIEDSKNASISDIEKQYNSRLKEFNDRVNNANQAIIDETEGVRGKTTSGIAGVGPRAIELQADLRKEEASVEIEKKEAFSNKEKEIQRITAFFDAEKEILLKNNQKEIEKIQKEYQTKKNSIEQGVSSIDSLIGEEGLVFEVNKAKSFLELADVSVKLNNSINIVSSKLNVEPKYISFQSENVIQMSFGALLKGEITALICFLLAVLLEIVDTIIVYMVRGVKKEKKKKYEEPVNNLRERIYY
jgi:hypothetical protein